MTDDARARYWAEVFITKPHYGASESSFQVGDYMHLSTLLENIDAEIRYRETPGSADYDAEWTGYDACNVYKTSGWSDTDVGSYKRINGQWVKQ